MRKTKIYLLKVIDDSGKEVARKTVIGSKEKKEIEKQKMLSIYSNKKG